MQTVLRFSKIPLTIHKTPFQAISSGRDHAPSLDQTLSQWPPLLVLNQAYECAIASPQSSIQTYATDLRLPTTAESDVPILWHVLHEAMKVTCLVAVKIIGLVVISCHLRFIGDVRCRHCGARKRKLTEFCIMWLLYTPSLSIRTKFGTLEWTHALFHVGLTAQTVKNGTLHSNTACVPASRTLA